MLARLNHQIIRKIGIGSSLRNSRHFSKFDPNHKTENEIKFEVEEVRIKLPFGHIAGKWWGNKKLQPIITMHGWQDNAGSFDRLIPLLPKDVSFLCLDMLGHGHSSRMPHGTQYHGIDNLYYLNLVLNELKMEKVSLMAHSMGSIMTFLFASVFPDKVNLAIGIDALKPHIWRPFKVPGYIEKQVKNFIKADIRNQIDSEPPAYSYDEIVERWCKATNNSITKEVAPYMMKRNIAESTKNPGNYYFTRDSRIKSNYSTNLPQEVSLELAKRIQIPYLFMKATKSPYYEDKKYFDETIEILKQNELFQLEFVEATHHLHLTHPEIVAPIVSKFLEKYWKPIPMV